MRSIIGVCFAWICSTSFAQSTAFTYQGQLKDGNGAADGVYDLRFKLYDAAAGGSQVGATVCLNNLVVDGGLFTTTLDFGLQFLIPSSRYIEVEARRETGLDCANLSGFVVLVPRQPITAVPLATHAKSAYSLDAPDGSPANAVFVNNAGYVGIGTNSPSGPLEVHSGDSSYVRIDAINGDIHSNGGNDGYFGIYNDSGLSGRTEFVGQGIPRLTVLNSGNVGIGTPAPNFPLSFGNSLSHTKIALYDASPTNHFGMGVVAGQFSFHLNGPGARYAFYDSDDLTNEIFTVFGNGTTRVKVLEITGADLAEKFPSTEPAQPGMVMAIDPENPGKLRMACGAYNRCVAGVVSGANEFAAGAILGNLPGHENSPPIALSGRVYVWCDASHSSIEPGDLLTTSDTLGHAMKAEDATRTPGTVIGKAMTRLGCGERGMVLVLVSLQ